MKIKLRLILLAILVLLNASAFSQNTNYESYISTQASWMKSIVKGYGDNPYGRLVEMAKLAQKDGVIKGILLHQGESNTCLLYTSPSPRDRQKSRMPSS